MDLDYATDAQLQALSGNLQQQIDELTTNTEGITGGIQQLDDQYVNIAGDVMALSSIFEEDYNKILESANAVSKEMGITASESLKLIEEGFKKGSNNTGEFLDILKEYPTQFKAAGIDAESMFAIINQQVREGIYSDKGVDAIKEAGLRLRENTKAVQDALAPLDESIKMQIKQEIAAGNIIPIDPRQLIVNMLSLCVFPVAAKPMLERLIFNNETEIYEQFIESRKKEVAKFIINSIKVK